MTKEHFRRTGQKMWQSIRANFRFGTLDFLFILAFVTVFQMVFGPENSIVGVIFTIMMAFSMSRDFTAAPVKHLLCQAGVLVSMAVAACLVSTFSPWAVLPLDLVVLFAILYLFTYEYASQLYFPYILSYLFLIFIAPITPEQLPKRVAGMLVGAVSIIVYQFVMGRKRVVVSTREHLGGMIDEALACISGYLSGEGASANPEAVRSNLCKLSRMVYQRRKKVLCISDASFAMLDVGRGLENLVCRLNALEAQPDSARRKLLEEVSDSLRDFKRFLKKETDALPALKREDFVSPSQDPAAGSLVNILIYIHRHLARMTSPQKQTRYRKTMLSFSLRLKAALDVSPVRLVYALRVAVLLAAGVLLTQLLHLPHGKWLLFTIASVSLPYADDVGTKAGKRFAATVIGGVIGMLLYALIPSMVGRTAIMMLSGYLSFYFKDYTGVFSCATIGALGGAVVTSAFGWDQVGGMLLIRLGYIGIGIGIALIGNCVVFPFRRRTATEQLWRKYERTTRLLIKSCEDRNADSQLYYSLVIQSHLMEEKLLENTPQERLQELSGPLEQCRERVRNAHRERFAAAA